MALFGFSDISFNKGSPQRTGPLGALVSSEFERTTLRYPLDIGNYDKGHYMVFYVREQKNTAYKGTSVDENLLDESDVSKQASAQASLLNKTNVNLNSNFSSDIINKINGGLNQVNTVTNNGVSGVTTAIGKAANGLVGGLSNLFGQKSSFFGGGSAATESIINTSIKKITNKSFLKTTKLTTDAIALYMPDTLQYTYTQSYDQLSLGGELGGQAMAAGSSVIDAFKSGAGALDAIKKAGASGGESAKLLGIQKATQAGGTLLGSQGTGQLAFTAITGSVQNPMLEMIYKSPNFRTFQFDFMFYPRDEKEALEVQRIVERFRFHQAPELVKGAQGFLVPPSEFDIKFYYGGAQNPNVPSVGTCILTSIDINYAPNGWSSYEIPGENRPALGRTGMPVAMQMTLQFQETTYLTKEDFNSGRQKGIVKNVNDPSNAERDN
jgi:hypothetical protein